MLCIGSTAPISTEIYGASVLESSGNDLYYFFQYGCYYSIADDLLFYGDGCFD